MTTALRPMSQTAFERFVPEAIAGYAHSNVQSGRWPAEGAVERSRDEFARLLPQGLSTPEQHFFDILDATEQSVGSLWFAVEQRSGQRQAFVFELMVQEPHRRQGHARRAFQAMEPIVRSMGLGGIGLHVFAYNTGAQALYRSLGYEVASLNMFKTLAG